MNYTLNQTTQPTSSFAQLKKLVPLLRDDRGVIILSVICIIINAALNLVAPLIIGKTIDTYITNGDMHGVLVSSLYVLLAYLGALVTSYLQMKMMGGVGQRVLHTLRGLLFAKLQELPLAFFNQNKSGDLISRINSDTERINQFFSQYLMQLIGSIFVMIGAAIFLITLHPILGLVTIIPLLLVVLFNTLFGKTTQKATKASLDTAGVLSADVEENISNFKAVIAFNRRDYFIEKLSTSTQSTYTSSVRAGILSGLYAPVYGIASSLAYGVVLVFGIMLITQGSFTLGLLVGFLSYVTNLYNPLRQIAAIWSNFQSTIASWGRVAYILEMTTNLTLQEEVRITSGAQIVFDNVSFTYDEGVQVLENINLTLHKGKTYALVGPTGGGKTTTASLIARLFDPTSGTIYLDGRNLGSYEHTERAQKIGFILQEPFMIHGTLRENIMFANPYFIDKTEAEIDTIITAEFSEILTSFSEGLSQTIDSTRESLSLGQKQIIAFMRGVLRKPEILILDEATANIDTNTEAILERILSKLPQDTTKIIIAHRLNTIENADEIYFVGNKEVTSAGSLQHAVEMLMQQ